MGVCCNCDKQDILTEIKKGTMAEGSASINYKYKMSEGVLPEQILLKLKENPLKDYSLRLFQEFNKFRTEPENYYEESIQYNYNNVVNDLISIKKNEKEKDMKLKWSTKKEIILNNILNDNNIKDIKSKLNQIKENFESIFDLIILFIQQDYDENIRNSIWKLLDNLKKMDNDKFDEIIFDKIDYCIIYSIKSEDLYISEEGEHIDENDKNANSVISFYFLFNYLDDNENSYNLNNNNVVFW
jgi:hypothetical protein